MPSDRRRAAARGVELPVRATGAVLFADVSGFTPMTEALVEVLGPRRGAERLTSVLDRVLGALIDDVERVGGAVVYFSGDAITVWLDGDDGSVAVACADAMQRTMVRVGTLEIGTQSVTLGLKVAVATGDVQRFVVGDETIQLIDVLAGGPLDAVADAEAHAEPGDVVVTGAVAAAIGARSVGSERRGEVMALQPAPPVDGAAGAPAAPVHVGDDVAAPWVLPAVRERLLGDDGAMVAELRLVLPMFIQFEGIDFTQDGARAQVDAFVTGAQRVLNAHGGALLQLTVGDKGAYLYGVFGAPVAHEDDPLRAVAAGMAVVALAEETGVTGVRVGISRGGVLSGVHGHVRRRTFVCLGDAVNLAARTMGKAGWGEVVVTPEVRAGVGPAVEWEDRPPVAMKGRAEPVPLSHALRVQVSAAAGMDGSPLLGRDDELAELRSRATPEGALAAVAVVGSAGVGTSRLVAELAAELAGAGRPVLRGTARVLGRGAPYQAWHVIWRHLLGLPEQDIESDAIEAAVAAIDPGLTPRAPLLGALLGVQMQDSALTAGMDARLRKASAEDLAVRILTSWNDRRPVIVLEDAHALDDVSRDLVRALRRARRRLVATVILVGRPPAPERAQIAELAGASIELRPLAEHDALQLLDHHLGLRFGQGVIAHPDVRATLRARAAGNPLAIAELVRSLLEQGADPTDAAAAELDLPASLEALVLARVDRLEDTQRRTLKVASVLLRSFLPEALVEVHPELGDVATVTSALEAMTGQLVTRDEGRFEVRHTLTREVTYGSLAFALRASLHDAVGRRVERRHADALAPRYDLLAHHFWHGESEGRRERYLRLAADAAKASYANESALLHLGRLASVTDGTDRVQALLDRGDVLMLIGRLSEARAGQQEAAVLAAVLAATGDDVQAGARVHLALAESARRAARFDEALVELAAAGDTFASLGDDAGTARALHLTGTIGAQRGDLEAAGVAYRAALAIRERTGDDAGRADLLSNLGIVAEYSGDLTESARLHTEALAIREELGDPWAVANSATNLGVIELLQGQPDDALGRFGAALQANEEVGDPWMVALAHHNLGNAQRDLGQLPGAMEEYAAAADHFAAAEDEWALALLFEDAAALAHLAGAPGVALELIGASDGARTRLDADRGPLVQAVVEATVDSASAALGDPAAARALSARGRERSTSSAVGMLLNLSRSIPVRD